MSGLTVKKILEAKKAATLTKGPIIKIDGIEYYFFIDEAREIIEKEYNDCKRRNSNH